MIHTDSFELESFRFISMPGKCDGPEDATHQVGRGDSDEELGSRFAERAVSPRNLGVI